MLMAGKGNSMHIKISTALGRRAALLASGCLIAASLGCGAALAQSQQQQYQYEQQQRQQQQYEQQQRQQQQQQQQQQQRYQMPRRAAAPSEAEVDSAVDADELPYCQQGERPPECRYPPRGQ